MALLINSTLVWLAIKPAPPVTKIFFPLFYYLFEI
jgi:hypothetical protein